ncbi:PTS sugar transporter subunit IIA [Holdemania filiformis]|uniref:PTS sugar transporter subunit IIA n=1 Tax=Holdemania filiformis TaxID=61171 RepID=UPI0026759BB1|nr:hypothetical protein [Holdemania filiformis]
MRKYLIATHGTMAAGIQDALQIIAGDAQRLTVINAFVGTENPGDQIAAYFSELREEDEVIAFTDLPGGSVNQMLMSYLNRPHIHLVSGVNLSLVLVIILNQEETDTCRLIQQAILESRMQMLYINEEVKHWTSELKPFF